MIPVFIAGMTLAPVVGNLFVTETPESSGEEKDSYFSM